MNIEDIQPGIEARLKGSASLDGKCVVLVDDGTYPKTPGREKALEETGLLLVVWPPESDGIVSQAKDGTSMQSIYCPVVIEENVKKNTERPGSIGVFKALRLVQSAVIGRLAGTPPNISFRLSDQPFESFGVVNGVRRVVANFSVILPVMPE